MKKEKNTELNFLYMDEKKTTKKKKTVKQNKMAKSKKKNVGAGNNPAQKSDTFNFDNEIVIGVTKLPDKARKNNVKNNTKNINSKTNNKKSNKNIKNSNKQNKKINGNSKESKRNINQNSKKSSRKNRIIKWIIKWTILICALIAAIIYFMMSPLFNLAEIQVINNEKITTDTIISMSGLTIGENIYKTSINKLKNNIKQNAYIESVDIKRKLPNKILITVKERKATFNLEYANSFAYINNQGYILEIQENKLDVPIIEGYTTNVEDIKPCNRLNEEDLEKLGVVLKIMESANANGISDLITKINIEDKQNYSIVLEGEKKTVYLGDASNLSNRMIYLKAILKEESGVEGEIFINGDLNKDNVFFRKKE